MKNSKITKLLCLLLVIVLAFSLVACGSKTDDADDGSADSKTEEKTDEGTESSDGKVVLPEGRVDENARETGHATSKDTIIIRLDEESGTLDGITGSWHPQGMFLYAMTGSTMLCEVATEDGVGFGINKYSLCDKVEYSDDYLTVTYHIRDGAKFHNGDPVLASDMVFSLKRWSASENVKKYIDLDGIHATDDQTVVVPRLNQSVSYYALIGRMTRIFQESAFKAAEADGTLLTKFVYGNEAMCGMYTFTEWVPGDHIDMVADPNYYTPANIKNLRIRFIPDNTVAMMELEAGGIDLLYSPGSTDIINVEAGQYGDKVSGVKSISDMMMYLGFNMTRDFFKDKNTRLALIHAVNWKEIVDVAWGSLGSYPTTYNAGTFMYQSDISEWWNGIYDPDLAKECWEKCDQYGKENTLKVILNNEATKTTACEIMGTYLKEFGITLEIECYDTATWSDMMTNSTDWDMWIRDFGGTGIGWGDLWDNAMGIADGNCHCKDSEEFAAENQELVDIALKHTQTADPDELKALGKQMEEGFTSFKWLYAFPMVQTQHVVLCAGNLKNWGRASNSWYIADAYFE